MSGDRAVVMLLYRCMLRWNRRLSSVPLELRPSHIDEVLPGFRKLHSEDTFSVRNLAQSGFRQHASGADTSTVRLACMPALFLNILVQTTQKVQEQLHHRFNMLQVKEEHRALLMDRGFRVRLFACKNVVCLCCFSDSLQLICHRLLTG